MDWGEIMKKWEYTIWQPTVPDLRVQRNKLEEMGYEGWELLLITSYRDKPVLYFKRPVKEEKKA